jgi:Arc/MetJ-type ribon-helix-helix transcriptional regulator
MPERITIRASEELDNRIEEQLDYGESKSQLIREAIREKLSELETEGSE